MIRSIHTTQAHTKFLFFWFVIVEMFNVLALLNVAKAAARVSVRMLMLCHIRRRSYPSLSLGPHFSFVNEFCVPALPSSKFHFHPFLWCATLSLSRPHSFCAFCRLSGSGVIYEWGAVLCLLLYWQAFQTIGKVFSFAAATTIRTFSRWERTQQHQHQSRRRWQFA